MSLPSDTDSVSDSATSEHVTMQLVEPPERTWIEEITLNQDAYDRERRLGKLLEMMRNLLEAGLSRDELEECIAADDLSMQD